MQRCPVTPWSRGVVMNRANGRARRADKPADLMAALSRFLRATFVANREQLLDEIHANRWRWSRRLSTRLDQVDEALISLGHFDMADAP